MTLKKSSKIIGSQIYHSSTLFHIRAKHWICPQCGFKNGKKNFKCHNKGCHYKYDNMGKVKISSKQTKEKYIEDTVKNLLELQKKQSSYR